jgi:GH43 family beta-xylosidase
MMHALKFPVIVSLLIVVFAIRADQEGNYGKPVDNTFTNPLLSAGPDPWVVQKDDWYYVTYTTGKNLRLYRTKRMSDLRNADAKTIWTPPASGMNSKQIWAPEIHFLDGKWYFYYAADDGRNENHRMWVLENAAEDPFTGTWVDKGELELPDDKWAIDGTPFEHNGDLYFLWSGWERDVNVRQVIYITRMENPYTAAGDRILLSKPEYPWEMKGGRPAINEGPQYIKHESKMFIVYSASGCWTDDYSLGLLSADAMADPTDVSAWTKHPEPVFKKNVSAQAYGPGHNSFFKSPDGSEDWILYHANPETGQGCGGKRSPRMQKFGWTTDGMPDFGTPVALGAAVERPSGEK